MTATSSTRLHSDTEHTPDAHLSAVEPSDVENDRALPRGVAATSKPILQGHPCYKSESQLLAVTLGCSSRKGDYTAQRCADCAEIYARAEELLLCVSDAIAALAQTKVL